MHWSYLLNLQTLKYAPKSLVDYIGAESYDTHTFEPKYSISKLPEFFKKEKFSENNINTNNFRNQKISFIIKLDWRVSVFMFSPKI